jgi:hypothetical protein
MGILLTVIKYSMKNNTTWIILALAAVLILVIVFAKPSNKNTDEGATDEASDEVLGTGGPDPVTGEEVAGEEGETTDPSAETPGFPKTGFKPE